MKISSLGAADGMFNLAQFAPQTGFFRNLGLDLTTSGTKEQAEEILLALLEVCSGDVTQKLPGMSGLVLEPEFGIGALAILKNKVAGARFGGVALTIDEPLTGGAELGLPKLINDWGVEQVRNNYAVAALTLYYHPGEAAALQKKQFLAEIYDYCHYEGIELLLKLMIVAPEGKDYDWARFRQDQLQALVELRDLAHLFVLQSPHDALACATITTELDGPWLLGDDNLIYDDFKEALRTALENGASGFLASESLFSEIDSLRRPDQSLDLPEIIKFIKTKTRDRALELIRISSEFSPSV